MSANFEIRIPHFYQLEYRENGRLLLLEIDFRDPVLYLDEGLISTWEPPHAKVAIDAAEKKRILDIIYDYLVRERGFQNVVYSKCGGCGKCCSSEVSEG